MKTEIRISEIKPLQEFNRKDGTGKYYRRQVIVYIHDYSQQGTDYLALSLSGDAAQTADQLDTQTIYIADICCSTHEWNGKVYQDLYARSIEPKTVADSSSSEPF